MPKNNQLTNQLWQNYSRSRSINDRNRLFEHYANDLEIWVVSVKSKLKPNFRADYDDLYNSGAIALLDAIEKFDIKRGTKFEVYAHQRVNGGIIDYLRTWKKRSKFSINVVSLDSKSREDISLHDALECRQSGEAEAELVEMLEMLPNELRPIMRMRMSGMTEREIASREGMSKSWVSWNSQKIFRHLREKLRLLKHEQKSR